MKIFLICPVRKAGDAVNERIAAYIAKGEAQGNQFHWPKRDTKQDGDLIGIRICRDNREAMFASDEVHVWYDPESRGSCFDIGMASVFETDHPGNIRIANLDEFLIAPSSPQLSLLVHLVSRPLEKQLTAEIIQRCWEDYPIDELFLHATLEGGGRCVLHSPPSSTGALCVYGQIFAGMRSTPYQITLGMPLEQTPEKSFNNVLLWLAEHTKGGPRTV